MFIHCIVLLLNIFAHWVNYKLVCKLHVVRQEHNNTIHALTTSPFSYEQNIIYIKKGKIDIFFHATLAITNAYLYIFILI